MCCVSLVVTRNPEYSSFGARILLAKNNFPGILDI